MKPLQVLLVVCTLVCGQGVLKVDSACFSDTTGNTANHHYTCLNPCLANGNAAGSQMFGVGGTPHVTCDSGFVLWPSRPPMRCRVDGTWSEPGQCFGKPDPHCHVTTCPGTCLETQTGTFCPQHFCDSQQNTRVFIPDAKYLHHHNWVNASEAARICKAHGSALPASATSTCMSELYTKMRAAVEFEGGSDSLNFFLGASGGQRKLNSNVGTTVNGQERLSVMCYDPPRLNWDYNGVNYVLQSPPGKPWPFSATFSLAKEICNQSGQMLPRLQEFSVITTSTLASKFANTNWQSTGVWLDPASPVHALSKPLGFTYNQDGGRTYRVLGFQALTMCNRHAKPCTNTVTIAHGLTMNRHGDLGSVLAMYCNFGYFPSGERYVCTVNVPKAEWRGTFQCQKGYLGSCTGDNCLASPNGPVSYRQKCPGNEGFIKAPEAKYLGPANWKTFPEAKAVCHGIGAQLVSAASLVCANTYWQVLRARQALPHFGFPLQFFINQREGSSFVSNLGSQHSSIVTLPVVCQSVCFFDANPRFPGHEKCERPCLANGNVTGTTRYGVGGTPNITCDSGFVLWPSRPPMRCRVDGTWSEPGQCFGKPNPHCHVTTCPGTCLETQTGTFCPQRICDSHQKSRVFIPDAKYLHRHNWVNASEAARICKAHGSALPVSATRTCMGALYTEMNAAVEFEGGSGSLNFFLGASGGQSKLNSNVGTTVNGQERLSVMCYDPPSFNYKYRGHYYVLQPPPGMATPHLATFSSTKAICSQSGQKLPGLRPIFAKRKTLSSKFNGPEWEIRGMWVQSQSAPHVPLTYRSGTSVISRAALALTMCSRRAKPCTNHVTIANGLVTNRHGDLGSVLAMYCNFGYFPSGERYVCTVNVPKAEWRGTFQCQQGYRGTLASPTGTVSSWNDIILNERYKIVFPLAKRRQNNLLSDFDDSFKTCKAAGGTLPFRTLEDDVRRTMTQLRSVNPHYLQLQTAGAWLTGCNGICSLNGRGRMEHNANQAAQYVGLCVTDKYRRMTVKANDNGLWVFVPPQSITVGGLLTYREAVKYCAESYPAGVAQLATPTWAHAVKIVLQQYSHITGDTNPHAWLQTNEWVGTVYSHAQILNIKGHTVLYPQPVRLAFAICQGDFQNRRLPF